MSLKVWLPLNGNLNNQGLSNINVINENATINTAGKIGSCYEFNGSTSRITINYLDAFKGGSNQFTYCSWIYDDDNNARSIYLGDYGTTGAIGINIEKKADNKIRFYWNGAPDKTFNCTVPNQTWFHLAITYDGTTIKCYANGILQDSLTQTLSEKNKTSGFYGIGRDSRSDTTAFKGKMNDLRIYDECLTQKQIKEIAKGLICHYKMTMSTINENLLLESNSPNRRYNTASYPCGAYNLKIPVVNGEQYTFSIKVTIEKAYKIGFYFGGGSYTPGWLTFPDSEGTFVMTQTFTANANQAAQSFVNVYVRDSQDTPAMGEARCIIHWIKLEKGNQVTSYVNDAFKQNEMLLNDCSGNNYNLNQKGDLVLNYDSSRYDNSTTFPGLNLNYLYRDKFNWLTAPFTFNCWCNQISRTAEAGTSTTTLQFVESQGRDCGYAGFSLCVANGKPRLYLGTSTSGTYWGINSNEEIELNTWHMLTGTYDGTAAKLYVDGVLKASQNSEDPISWEHANGFTIGKMAYAHTSTQNYFPFNGSISDVRIYATALSAEEILTLYKNSGIIDNNNSIYTREFKEV